MATSPIASRPCTRPPVCRTLLNLLTQSAAREHAPDALAGRSAPRWPTAALLAAVVRCRWRGRRAPPGTARRGPGAPCSGRWPADPPGGTQHRRAAIPLAGRQVVGLSRFTPEGWSLANRARSPGGRSLIPEGRVPPQCATIRLAGGGQHPCISPYEDRFAVTGERAVAHTTARSLSVHADQDSLF